jgi:hypothetical protein
VRPEGLGKFKNSPDRVSNPRPSGSLMFLNDYDTIHTFKRSRGKNIQRGGTKHRPVAFRNNATQRSCCKDAFRTFRAA